MSLVSRAFDGLGESSVPRSDFSRLVSETVVVDFDLVQELRLFPDHAQEVLRPTRRLARTLPAIDHSRREFETLPCLVWGHPRGHELQRRAPDCGCQ